MRPIFSLGIFTLIFSVTLSNAAFAIQIKVLAPQGPVAQQQCEVFYFENGEASAPELLKTNSAGRSQIKRQKISPELSLAARCQYQGIMYVSSIYQAKQGLEIPIFVYPKSSENSGVKVSTLQMSLEEVESGLRVEQEIVIANDQKTTFENPEGLKIELPKSSFDLQLGPGFDEQTTKVEGNSVHVSKPIIPGELHLQLSFSVEKKPGSIHFSQTLPFAASNAYLLLMSPNLKLKGPGLKQSQKKFFAGSLRPSYEISNPPSSKIEFQIEGFSWTFNWKKILPLLIPFLGLLGLLFIPRAQRQVETLDSKQEIDQLKALQSSWKEGRIAEIDYQLRRIQSLEKLFKIWKRQNGKLI